MATATQQRPVFSTRHARLDAAVWKNQGDKNTFFTVSLKKSYKDGDDWSHTQATFGRDDTLAASKLLNWADDVINDAIQSDEKFNGSDKPFSSKTYKTLEAAVFQKMVGDKLRYRVSLKRSYKDGDAMKSVVVWLLPGDCLAAGRLLTRAFDAIDDHLDGSTTSTTSAANQYAAAANTDDDIPF